jgi:hypothetical protein
MKRVRTLAVISSIALIGAVLGTSAGAATVAAGVFTISLRNGQVVWPFTGFGSLFGGLIGGVLGFVLAAALPFTPWRYVPVGRLFAHLTIGTIIGGCASAMLVRDPTLAILGGIIGFVLAGSRLTQPSTASHTRTPQSGPRAPSG